MFTSIIVGAGHRSMCYASYAKERPDRFRIVGVADPNPIRCKKAINEFGIKPDMVFHDAAELASRGKLADCIINGTMDGLLTSKVKNIDMVEALKGAE